MEIAFLGSFVWQRVEATIAVPGTPIVPNINKKSVQKYLNHRKLVLHFI